jgi:hypothetical protein
VAAAALRLARVQLRRPGHWLAAIAGTSLLLAGILAPVPLILIGAGTGVLLQWLCPKPERKP